MLLKALERLLVRPGLDCEVELGVEADTEDDDGEEGHEVAASSTARRLRCHCARGMWRVAARSMPPAAAVVEISRIDAAGEVRRLRDWGMEKL